MVVALKRDICQGQTEPCVKEAGKASGRLLLHLSQPATSAQLASLLAPYQRYQRIHLNQPHELFARFELPAEQQQYESLTRKLTVEWCCRPDEDVAKGKVKRHMVVMRPWAGRQHGRLCDITTLDGKNVSRWC